MNNIVQYDSISGISEYLTDLDGLNKLVHDRHAAGYDRHERMQEFVILGRWITDSCGNFSKIDSNGRDGIIPALSIPRCPKVLLLKDMFTLVGEFASICSGMNSHIPPSYAKCISCEDGWTISDAYDCISTSNTEVVDADQFIGQKLVDIKSIPLFENIYPHRIHTDSIRPKHLSKGSDRVDKDYIIKDGDKLFASVWNYSHIECNDLKILKNSYKEMNTIIHSTGFLEFNDYDLVLVKNKYSSDRKDPWYRLIFGPYEITLGWRKSVISICWEKSKKDLSNLFENENVTKDPFMIHAHGYDKAIEYLKKIIPALVD